MSAIFGRGFSDAQAALADFSAEKSTVPKLEALANHIVQTICEGGKVMICGNGGSMADAMHFAEEFTGRFKKDRRPYPVMAFSDPTHLTCVGNDYGFEHTFSRLVEAFGKPGDILIVLSTSGNSANILAAIAAAKQAQVATFGFLGKTGGEAFAQCDTAIVAPGESSDRIQEIHMMSLHLVIEVVENLLGH